MQRIALALGIIGGFAWISVPFFPPECAPVTGASEVFCNRLWTPPLTAMFIGAAGLYSLLRPLVSRAATMSLLAMVIGFAMLAIGNGGEYWLASDLPHQGGVGALVRSLLWMTVLAGWWLALIAAVVTGVRLYSRTTGYGQPRWPSLLFVLPLPVTFVFATLWLGLIGIPVGLLAIVIGVYGLAQRDETATVPT